MEDACESAICSCAAVVVFAACSENDQNPTAPNSPSLATGDNGMHGKPEPHVFLQRGFAKPGDGGSPNLINHGGPVLPSAKSKAIFWGSSWNNASFAGDKITGLDTFFRGFDGSNFAGTNTEYSNISTRLSYIGHVIDPTEPPAQKRSPFRRPVAEACSVTGNNPDPSAVYFLYTSTTAGHVWNYLRLAQRGGCAAMESPCRWPTCRTSTALQAAIRVDRISTIPRVSPHWRT